MRAEIKVGKFLQEPVDFVKGLFGTQLPRHGNRSQHHDASGNLLVEGLEHSHRDGIRLQGRKIMPPHLSEGRLFTDIPVNVVSGQYAVHVKINHAYSIGTWCDLVKEDFLVG